MGDHGGQDGAHLFVGWAACGDFCRACGCGWTPSARAMRIMGALDRGARAAGRSWEDALALANRVMERCAAWKGRRWPTRRLRGQVRGCRARCLMA